MRFFVVQKDLLQERKCGVSDEEVVVLIKCPEASSTHFVDLPGIIASDKSGDEFKKTVDALVEDRLQRPNTTVLVTIPANCDLDNEKILNTIKEAGKLPHTIGILTKPDLMSEDTHKNTLPGILDARDNEFHPERFFLVKNPSESEEITDEEAQKGENKFFETDSFFKDINRKHVGIPNLKSHMEEVMFSKMDKTVEELLTFTKQKKRETLNEKEDLKREIHDRKRRLNMLRNKYSRKIGGRKDMMENNLYVQILVKWEKETIKLIKDIHEHSMTNEFSLLSLEDKIEKYRGMALIGLANFSFTEKILKSYIRKIKDGILAKIIEITREIDSQMFELIKPCPPNDKRTQIFNNICHENLRKMNSANWERCQKRLDIYFKTAEIIFQIDEYMMRATEDQTKAENGTKNSENEDKNFEELYGSNSEENESKTFSQAKSLNTTLRAFLKEFNNDVVNASFKIIYDTYLRNPICWVDDVGEDEIKNRLSKDDPTCQKLEKAETLLKTFREEH